LLTAYSVKLKYLGNILNIKDVTNMNEDEIVEAITELTNEIRELRNDVEDLKGILRSMNVPPPSGQALEVPPWLRFEVMESLARAGKPMSTEEIAEGINERRGMVEEKTSRASVSRCISELVKKGFVVQDQVGRRIFYRLTGKAQVLYSEGKTLEEAVKKITSKVIEANGRQCNAYMMSIITPDMRKDAKKIADEIFADEHKKGEISVKSSNRYDKSEISLLLIP